MSCYHPLAAVKTGNLTDKGKEEFKVIGKYNLELQKDFEDQLVLIPCGKCLGCRLNYSRYWADRMMYELDHCHGKAIFVTLTYNEEHVPKVFDYDPDTGECLDTVKWYTLDKRDFQLFFKRLRQHFKDREVKFYLGAEYGPKTLRPHGHAVIFNLSLDDFADKKQFGVNELGDPYYVSDEFTDIWQNGFTLMSEVSWKTCAYVSRYVMKKAVNGNGMVYDMMGVSPEFSLMSRRPGIGSRFFEDHPDCIHFDSFYLNDGRESRKLPITKNLLNYLEKVDIDRYNEIKECHKVFANDSMLLELMQSDLGFSEYYEKKELEQLLKLNTLRRQKV